jgi:methionyl-tRNA formyltransferase
VAETAPGVAFLGSGSLGVPTLEALHAQGLLRVVVSQPDRPAGRGLKLVPTPVSEWALAHGVPLVRTENANEGPALEAVRAAGGPLVVVAFGQKLGPELLQGRCSVNLHPSALPRWRGAAPIQRAMLAGESRIGVCAIAVAERMDAGTILDAFEMELAERETAAEALDRAAIESVPMMLSVVRRLLVGDAAGREQDHALATRAAKLSKADASVDLSRSADAVRLRVHGLQPWPGCVVRVGGQEVRWLRLAPAEGQGSPGELLSDGRVACGRGAVRPIEVQPPGGKAMAWADWLRGRRLDAGARVESAFPSAGST